MKKNFLILIFSLFFLLTFFFITQISKNFTIFKEVWKVYNQNNCEIKKEFFSVNGFSMQPMIKDKEEIEVFLNYYNCSKNKPKDWDIVIFENPYTLERIIKKLYIIPWDEVKIDKETNTIKVNGKKLVNSQNQAYIFKEPELKWFEIYTENGKVIENTYFIFWDNIYWSIDSRSFWPITLEGLIWKKID